LRSEDIFSEKRPYIGNKSLKRSWTKMWFDPDMWQNFGGLTCYQSRITDWDSPKGS